MTLLILRSKLEYHKAAYAHLCYSSFNFWKDWKSHFKFADDSSVLIEAESTENLNAQLKNACRDIEN